VRERGIECGRETGGESSKSDLTPELREALARVAMSTLIGALNRRSLRSMCFYDVWSIRASQPRFVGIGYTMRFIPSRADKDEHASTNCSTVQPQAMKEWRGGEP
jgi:hypothetical protein